MVTSSVQIKGKNTNGGSKGVALIERYLDLLGTTNLEQIAVSLGWYFAIGHYDPAVADSAAIKLLIRTGAIADIQTDMLGGLLASGGDSLLEVYITPDISADGTSLGILQVNQLSANTPKFLAFHTPTVVDLGTLIFRLFIPGGAHGNSIGGTSSPFQRLLTLPNTDYIICGTNLSGQAKKMSVNLNIVEVPQP